MEPWAPPAAPGGSLETTSLQRVAWGGEQQRLSRACLQEPAGDDGQPPLVGRTPGGAEGGSTPLLRALGQDSGALTGGEYSS